MRVLSLILAAALTGCANAPAKPGAAANPDGSMTITVSAQRVAECKEQGGCALVTRAQVDELMGLAAQAALSEVESCQRGRL